MCTCFHLDPHEMLTNKCVRVTAEARGVTGSGRGGHGWRGAMAAEAADKLCLGTFMCLKCRPMSKKFL